MDIMTILTDLATEILAAQNAFYERPEQMSAFEHSVVDVGNRAARVIGQSLTGLDEMIRQSYAREERFVIQRRIERTLITTAGAVTFEQTVFREKETGRYRCLLETLTKMPSHERFSALAEAKVLSEAEEHSYRHAAESVSYKGQTVSKAAVMEKVHKITEELPKPEVVNKKQERILYIEATEDHIHRQKDEKDGCILGSLCSFFMMKVIGLT